MAAALKERGEVEAKLAALSASSARLHQQVEAVGPAESALARHDADAQRSHSPRGRKAPRPTFPSPTGSSGSGLNENLALREQPRHQPQRRRPDSKRSTRPRPANCPAFKATPRRRSIEIIGESLPELIDEVIELQKQVANKIEVVVSAVDVTRDLMMRLAGPSRAVASTAFTALAQRAAAVHEKRSADVSFAMKAKAAWNQFVEDLSRDAGVMFAPVAS